MFIIKPYIFNSFPEIVSGVSTKSGLHRHPPYYFNLSFNVNDDIKNVEENRNAFLKSLGIDSKQVAFQNQVHSDIISIVESPGNCGESDALITSCPDVALAVTIADCTPVLIYDKRNKIIAAVHSGWRGAASQIVTKTLMKMNQIFKSDCRDLVAYLGPSISGNNYEVGKDVADLFDKNYILKSGNKTMLDVQAINYNLMIEFGVPENNIQKSCLCTFQFKDLLHSYRRDGDSSGRSLAVIMMRNY